MDPAKLSDEELDNAINGDLPIVAEEEAEEPVTPVEPEEPNVPEITDGEEGEEEEEVPKPPEVEEPKPPSRREQLRVAQLLERYNVNQGQQAAQQPSTPREDAIDYAELDADPALIKRLQDDRQQAETARYQEGLEQAKGYEWRTLLHVDAPQMESKYPQLDKNSEDFHPAVSNALSTMYLQMSGYNSDTGLPTNPGMRWNEFVPAFMELAEEIATTKNQKTVVNTAKQAATTALRPDGSSTKRLNLNQAPGSMSDEELDAIIAQAIPPKR